MGDQQVTAAAGGPTRGSLQREYIVRRHPPPERSSKQEVITDRASNRERTRQTSYRKDHSPPTRRTYLASPAKQQTSRHISRKDGISRGASDIAHTVSRNIHSNKSNTNLRSSSLFLWSSKVLFCVATSCTTNFELP